jgi:OOP family OmpA-OmpF porin
MAKKTVLVLMAAFAISIPAFAADTGGYLVGSVGQSKFKDLDTTGIANASVKDTDTGIKLGGGYAFNRNLAVEGAYVDFGKATASAGGQTVEAKASGLVVVGVGMLPLNNQFTLLGRLGVINGTVKLSGPGGSESATKLKTTFGIGVAYSLTSQFAVRADYDSYKKLGDNNTTGESDVSLISIGVVYKFQ